MRINRVRKKEQGFTLIEVMTSVAIFTLLVTFGLSALLLSNDGLRRTRSEGQSIDTVAFILESMARRIRTGSNYDCDPGTPGLQSCTGFATPSNIFEFVDQDGIVVRYEIVADIGGDYYLQQTVNGVLSTLTSPQEIILKPTSLLVNVFGASESDFRQPRVVLGLIGETRYQGDAVGFSLQTSVTQRLIQEQE